MQKPLIYLGADHAGFEMKNSIKHHLELQGFEVEDLGAHSFDENDDYPEFATAVAEAVRKNPRSLGILSCGNATGITIAANKFDGIRAGIGYSKLAAKTMRNDDNANIISIPGRLEVKDDPLEIVDTFLESKFSFANRHIRRLNKVSKIEETN
jgi:ribose 5-phosphate isomerase B